MDDVIAHLGAEMFQSAIDPGGAAAARKVFQPRRAHPQLIVPVADYLEERFAAAASAKGTV